MTEAPKKPLPVDAEPAAEAGDKKKRKRRGRSSFAWFIAGLALSGTIVLGLLLWNAYSEPRIIISPALDMLVQKFSGYVLAGALILFAVVCAGILRRRWAWLVPGGFVLAGATLAIAGTVLLMLGDGAACGKRLFETASPDRRLLVVAMRGNCGETTGFTYTVVVRELGPSFPRQSTIFKSSESPVPSEVTFSTERTLTLLATKPNEKLAQRYTVTIERRSLRPDKVWRFRRGPIRNGS
jgi:hypothetical protein